MKSSSEHKKATLAVTKQSVIKLQPVKPTAAKKAFQPKDAKKPQPEAATPEKSAQKQSTKLRPATPEDADWASKLLFLSFPRMAVQIIGLGKEERAKKILAILFKMPVHRLSFEKMMIAEDKGHRIGILVSVPGKDLGKANRKLGRKLHSFYKLNGKLALVRRGFPLVFIKEAGKKDYLISNLAVLPRHQGQGHGKALLKAAEKQARATGHQNCVVMVEVGNTHARRVFEHLGYKVQSIVLESNRRVQAFGAGYQRMTKKL